MKRRQGKPNSRKFKRRKYKIVTEKSNGKCWYCGLEGHKMIGKQLRATRDHQLPKARGGTKDPKNLVLACHRCNNEKGSMDVEAYRWFLQERRPLGEKIVFYGERCRTTVWWLA